jgi:hypothetical protein
MKVVYSFEKIEILSYFIVNDFVRLAIARIRAGKTIEKSIKKDFQRRV